MRTIYFSLFALMLFSCGAGSGHDQQEENRVKLALCEHGKGCKIIPIANSVTEIAQQLGHTEWQDADSSIAVIAGCALRKETELSMQELHESYGGTDETELLKNFDIQNHLKKYGCAPCKNETKKISFYVSAGGEEPVSGNGYFYLNLKGGEAYMPKEALQQLYVGTELEEVVVDQFLRNGKMEQYTIVEGKKYYHAMPIGNNIAVIGADALNEKRFKEEFVKTGNTRKHLNTNSIETEYKGKDDEGTMMSFWTVPIQDICLPAGKFDAWGFYNLGYIAVDGMTYLVTEISGGDFQIRLTAIADGSYSFNPAGYQSY